ncbi:MAG: exodeoxyribonuclease VII large subunit [Planctomycetes bacterium]|nr:exodeoxyribonuclease VII large subunit [Planctomycetota bacterium]
MRKPFDPSLVPDPTPTAALPSGPLSVSQLTAIIKRAIETTLPATVHVLGELSNLKRHSSGHLYFTLKDRSSELACVMWRSEAAKMKFTPADGMEVIATGTVEVFERAGRYQLYARKIEPRGVGSLELAFRQLCEKLAQEGLFDAGRKKPLPAYPNRVVLVTSPTGAAVTDMLRTLTRRFPCLGVLVYPVRVQGDGAAAEIAAAIRNVNRCAESLGGVDVMIVGRGGGSVEDLWAFNEEVVARAIFASRIPIISAVGHEVDVTIADLVADVRAATPTAAAELAVPVLEDVLAGLAILEGRLRRAAVGQTALAGARLGGVVARGPFREPLAVVRRREQFLDELADRPGRALRVRMQAVRRRVEALEAVVQRIAPHAYLLRSAVRLRDAEHRLRRAVERLLERMRQGAAAAQQRLRTASPATLLPRWGERLTRHEGAMLAAVRHAHSLLRERVQLKEEVLSALSYKSVLGRGFSITRLKRGRAVVRSLAQIHDHDRTLTEVADGEFEAEVLNLRQLELFE